MKEGYTFVPGAVLRITGEDHEEFLQNQGTADLRGDAGLCRYCLWLDYKGRIQADSFVLKLDGGQALLVSYASAAEELAGKFQNHIISEDVVVTDETPDWRLLSVLDDEMDAKEQDQDRFRIVDSGYAFPGRRLGSGTIDYLLPSNTVFPEVDRLLTEEEAEEKRILGGVPMVPQDTGCGQMNPVESGLLSAVSFDKGCYLGQEVVTRVHRLQRFSRQLVRVRGRGPVPAMPQEIMEDDVAIGCLTSASGNGEKYSAIGWLKASRMNDVDALSLHGLDQVVPIRS